MILSFNNDLQTFVVCGTLLVPPFYLAFKKYKNGDKAQALALAVGGIAFSTWVYYVCLPDLNSPEMQRYKEMSKGINHITKRFDGLHERFKEAVRNQQ